MRLAWFTVMPNMRATSATRAFGLASKYAQTRADRVFAFVMVFPLCCQTDIDNAPTGTVRREPYDYVTLALAQLTCSARNILPLSGRANDNPTPCRCRGVRGLVRRQHDDDRTGAGIGERIGIGQVVCRQIYGKAPFVRMPNPCERLSVTVVAVREATFPLIGCD